MDRQQQNDHSIAILTQRDELMLSPFLVLPAPVSQKQAKPHVRHRGG
jgi:hypothetical protein